MAGLEDKVKGKAKEVKGAATGDKKTEMEGKAQGAKGNLKDTAHKATH
ncbi:MAG TPA: CsbD family protein [Chloroflexota bacterium]|nr:CsbD family protein [Chloroflexota bacterium]